VDPNAPTEGKKHSFLGYFYQLAGIQTFHKLDTKCIARNETKMRRDLKFKNSHVTMTTPTFDPNCCFCRNHFSVSHNEFSMLRWPYAKKMMLVIFMGYFAILMQCHVTNVGNCHSCTNILHCNRPSGLTTARCSCNARRQLWQD